MGKHQDNRKPPRPATWDSPKGNCRLCGEAIIEKGVQNKRKNWHCECIALWLIMSCPTDARKHVWHREKGVCQGCGRDSWTYASQWHVDHHKPLFEAENDLSYWHPDNLRLLCQDCHRDKTNVEATRRALNRKVKEIDHDHNL